MINTETIKGSVRIHGVRTLTAEAGPNDPVMRDSAAWLTLKTQHNDEVVLFMPYETALAYAQAINTVNDREAEEAYVIPVKVWRELNMGVPDVGKDTDTDR